jgi:predicted HTH transcriptional regulator
VETGMKRWLSHAQELLVASLSDPPHELNELDWKLALSSDKRRLTEHLSAMANLPGGGTLVFGINAHGLPADVDQAGVEKTVTQLANLGRDALDPPQIIEHAVAEFRGVQLLWVHVPESAVKPVHLRGKSLEDAFVRSGASTRRASRQEIGTLMLNSRTPRWETLNATSLLTDAQVTAALQVRPILAMLGRPVPSSTEELLAWMVAEDFVRPNPSGGNYVTHLGAVAAAENLADFDDVGRKTVRLIVYEGTNKVVTRLEQELTQGYAVGFQSLMQRVMAVLPQSEHIEQGLRRVKTVYPEIALREVIANALIHQDFTVRGAGPMVEIFDDRVEVSNPGGLLPSKQVNRLIGTQPESRNELLAKAFRRYRICEERGSGLLKAGQAVEEAGLPPIDFTAEAAYFKVTLRNPRSFARMTVRERLEACHQHAVLRYFSGTTMTNTTLRARLRMPEKQRPMVSALIQEALDMRLIKPADPDNKSRKFAEYVPYWA